MNKFLATIAEEKLGFSFGESWRYNEDSLVALLPILRESRKKRMYMLLNEAKNIEIKDTGQINKVEIKNKEKKPVYVRMGEILAGKTQERATTRSYIIMPGESIKVDVRCVHASKGINQGEDMISKGVVTADIEKSFNTCSYRGRSAEQSKVWQSVSDTSFNLSASATQFISASSDIGQVGDINLNAKFTDDLSSNINNFSKIIDKVLKKVPHFDNQVGIATLDLKGVAGIECFDLKDSWKALRDAIIEKEGEQLSKQDKDSPFEYKKNKAVRSVKNLLLLDFEEKILFKSEDYRLIGLKIENYIGELTEFKGEPIHLTLTRNIK